MTTSIVLSNIINTIPGSLVINGLNASVIAGGIVPIKSSQSIDMTLYYGGISMVNNKSTIAMDASGENMGMLH